MIDPFLAAAVLASDRRQFTLFRYTVFPDSKEGVFGMGDA
jgi:hypothetical protein